jgi:hypothetical protein
VLANSALDLSFMGDYDGCRHARHTVGDQKYENMQYCTLSAEKLSMTQGLCMPRECSSQDLDTILLSHNTSTVKEWVHVCGGQVWNGTCTKLFPNKVERDLCLKAFAGLEPILDKLFTATSSFNPATVHCDLSKNIKWSWGAITMLAVCSILILLTAIQFLREQTATRDLTEEEAAFFPDTKGSINEAQPLTYGTNDKGP